MDWEQALRARLKAAAPVAAIVGTKIDWDERPQGKALPAITLQTIDEPTGQHFDGEDGLQRVLVQIDAWAVDAKQRRELKVAVKTALLPGHEDNGIRFDRAVVRGRDGLEQLETKTIYRSSMDFTFHYAAT